MRWLKGLDEHFFHEDDSKAQRVAFYGYLIFIVIVLLILIIF